VAEKRSFGYFQSRACQDLGGCFNLSFWAGEVLQASLHYPSVRHLIVALGAAYETFELRQQPDESAVGQQLVLQQCNLSIRHMSELFSSATTDHHSNETVCCILTASILFTYISSLQGHLTQAIEHIRSGMKVLLDFEKLARRPDVREPYPVPLSRLRSLLMSMYGQLRAIINDEALSQWGHGLLASDLEPVIRYVSVSEAHDYVERLFQNTLAFLQDADFSPPTTHIQIAASTARRAALCRALDTSRTALEILSRQSPEAKEQAKNGVTILRTYHILIDVRLRIDPLQPSKREDSFDDMEADLEKILDNCEILVNHGRKAPQLPSCSSGLGYVMPLHTVAARCRNPGLRKRALGLLLSIARRECLWDSVLTGKIVAKTQEIEEQSRTASSPSSSHGPVASDLRVREVKITFEGDRKAHLNFIAVEDWRKNQPGIQHFIEW